MERRPSNARSRRRFLRAMALGASAGLAGCLAAAPSASGPGTDSPTARRAVDGVELPVPKSDLVRGAPEDAIPAITEPAFGRDWSGVTVEYRSRFGGKITSEPRLTDDDPVIGVTRDGAARAYPLAVLNWHEVVNDTFGGPLLVTYCPLCASGVTAERRVGGEPTEFGVSGYLFKNALVMDDEATGSLWSQILAMAINGTETGQTLELVPSSSTTWGSWREDHPDTEVLRPPPESNTIRGREATRDYTTDPYYGYKQSDQTGLDGDGPSDDRLHPKAKVIGVVHGGETVAYPLETVTSTADGVLNDAVGGLPIVVTADEQGSMAAFVRTVEDTPVRFAPAGPGTMTGADSTWGRVSGRARDGAFEDTQLRVANDRSPMFWFAWVDFFPETAVYGRA